MSSCPPRRVPPEGGEGGRSIGSTRESGVQSVPLNSIHTWGAQTPDALLRSTSRCPLRVQTTQGLGLLFFSPEIGPLKADRTVNPQTKNPQAENLQVQISGKSPVDSRNSTPRKKEPAGVKALRLHILGIGSCIGRGGARPMNKDSRLGSELPNSEQ